MRLNVFFFLLLLTGFATAHPLERYQRMMARSPFAPASEAPAAPEATEGFAKDFVLTGVVRMGEGAYITVSSRDKSRQFSLSGDAVYQGISIAGIQWSDHAGGTKVTLKRGGEYGVIGFDEAAIRAAPTPAPVAQSAAQNPRPRTRATGTAASPPRPRVIRSLPTNTQ